MPMKDNIQETVKQTVKEEVDRVARLSSDAVRSGAYLYPVRGIYYFFSHRSLWKPLTDKLIPTLGLGITVTAAMFIFTYVPQLAIMAFTSGPAAPLTTALLVLSESQTVFNLLNQSFVVQDALIDTFDSTLIAKDQTHIVAEGRQITSGKDAIGKLGKILKRPFEKYSPQAFIRYLMYLPLNFIPVVGTIIFILLQGRQKGSSAHARYYQLKGWSAGQRAKWEEEHSAAYTSFGVPAVLLETIPIANVFFAFTNTVGAALWAADLEKHGSSSSTAPKLQEQARQAQ